NKGDEIEDMEGGFRVLKSAQKSQVVKEFVVISGHNLPENIVNAFRGGALDFFAKPILPRDLRTPILQRWKRVFDKKSVATLDQRIKEMTHYTAKGLAHSFTKVFSALVQTTANVADKIETYASERYGLDPDRDKQDALMRYLLIQREAINNGRQDWAKL